MAFTKNPAESTYKSFPLSFVPQNTRRSADTTTRNEEYVNVIPEIVIDDSGSKKVSFRKRPGFSTVVGQVGSVRDRGMFLQEETNRLFVATGANIRVYNATTGALLASFLACFTTTTGTVGFVEFLYTSGAKDVVASDGIRLLTISPALVLTTGVDADMPTPHQPTPVFLDGYLFLIKTSTGDVFNSNLNAPLTYTAGDFISVESVPDLSIQLVRLNNYIIVFSTSSIEYFYNAGIAGGSPLQRFDAPIKYTGIYGPACTFGNKVFFVGKHTGGLLDVFVLEDTKVTSIGSPGLRREVAFSSFTPGDSLYGNIVTLAGHDLYVLLSLGTAGTVTNVYDITSGMWVKWKYRDSDFFAITYSTNGSARTNDSFFMIRNDSAVYHFVNTVHQDDGVNFSVDIITPNEDYGSFNQKTMHRLVVHADDPGVFAPCVVRWSDDDFQTFNSGVTINLNDVLPVVRRMGTFRRRAIRFTFTQNMFMRFFGGEVDINLGQH